RTVTVSGAGFVNLGAVPSGITLAGTGMVRNPLVIAGGAVNPGNMPGTGTLTAAGGIAFASGSTDYVELAGTATGSFDQIASGGTVDLNSDGGTGATLNVSLMSG